MNKKFLSAILFGALMVTSTGTFVSCKDYDDDIKNLQTQIDKNSSAIAELQKLVGQGKWVSSISSIENGFTVNMSDGSSHQIKGINGKDGADGKNGTEWTIGEDGFWYVDGEKTENVAVAKDGKNGVTAPSPSIGADGNWIVYNWDEAKGEFVAEATEIPAAGTAAYAVETNGVYTLHIADANGEYQEIVLPATTDAFVVASPSPVDVDVVVEKATWNTLSRNKQDFAALAKAFPEVEKLAKGDKLTQGGELPLMVSPTELELDETFSFSLVDMKGKIANIELSNPTKGIADDWKIKYGTMSRSANGEAGLWTLNVTPAFENKKYVTIENGALIVTNAKGTASRTAFAYFVSTEEVENVVVASETNEVEYADVIDVLAANKDNKAIFTLTNEYYGKYILEATSAVEIEKYDISIEGSELTIGSMPANEMDITISLKMIALGLNGSTDSETVKLTIKQTIGATASLSEKAVTLSNKAQEVRWDVEELGMTALQFDNFMSSEEVYVTVTREADKNEDEEAEKYVAHNAEIQFYNAKGKVTKYEDEEWTNGEGVTFGFDVNALAAATAELEGYIAERWLPAVYTVNLISKDGNTILYSAETELTVSNPTAAAISLVPEFVENGVLQAVGVVSNHVITYDFAKGLKVADNITINGYDDMDFIEYRDAEGDLSDKTEMASNNWITNNKLVIKSYNEDNAEENPAEFDCLEKVRNIRANYTLFNNNENQETFEFQVLVKSAVWSATPTEVVTMTAASLALPLNDNPSTEKVFENTVDLAKITKAVLAYGPNAGKEYKLWNTGGSAAQTGLKKYHNNLGSPKTLSDFVVDANNNFVEIEVNDLLLFGYSEAEVAQIKLQGNDAKPVYIKYENATTGKTTWKNVLDAIYNNKDLTTTDAKGKTVHVFTLAKAYDGESTVAGAWTLNTTACDLYIKNNPNTNETKCLTIFKKYYAKMAYDTIEETYDVAAVDPSGVDYSLLDGEAQIVAVDAKTADNFVAVSGTTITARLKAGVDMTTDTVEVPFKLVINDAWGKTMEVPFTITVNK